MPKLLLLPGDGIGPEVTAQARRVAEQVFPALTIEERLFGGCSFDALGTPLSDETLAAAKSADAVLMGAVGGAPGAWANAPRHHRPEAGLLNLRTGMQVYANLRPALCFGPLAQASSLKPELIEGLDIMIVRELTGGVYFGQPRFIEDLPGGGQRAVDTQVYTTMEIERVCRVAFELARGRRNKVTSCEKSRCGRSSRSMSSVTVRTPLVIIHDLSLEHVAVTPDEANPPLVVDPDAVLTGSVSHQRFQPISRRLA